MALRLFDTVPKSESDTRFSASGFFLNQCPRAPEYPIKEILILMKIRGDIREWMFVTSVNNTEEKNVET